MKIFLKKMKLQRIKNKKKDEKAEIVNANININKEQGAVKDYVVTNHEEAIQKTEMMELNQVISMKKIMS